MRISENASLILDPPIDKNTAGIATETPFIDMAQGKDLLVKLTTGAIGASGTCLISLVQDILGDGAGDQALAYAGYYTVTTAADGDVPVYTAGALTIGAADDNKIFLIEVDSTQLDVDDLYRFVKCGMADPIDSMVLGVELILTMKRDVTASAST